MRDHVPAGESQKYKSVGVARAETYLFLIRIIKGRCLSILTLRVEMEKVFASLTNPVLGEV